MTGWTGGMSGWLEAILWHVLHDDLVFLMSPHAHLHIPRKLFLELLLPVSVVNWTLKHLEIEIEQWPVWKYV